MSQIEQIAFLRNEIVPRLKLPAAPSAIQAEIAAITDKLRRLALQAEQYIQILRFNASRSRINLSTSEKLLENVRTDLAKASQPLNDATMAVAKLQEIGRLSDRVWINTTSLYRQAVKSFEQSSSRNAREIPALNNPVINQLYKESTELTDTSNIGNNRIRSKIVSDQTVQNITRNNNISGLPNSQGQTDGGLNTSLDGRDESNLVGTTQRISEGESGASGFFSGAGGGAPGTSDPQKLGRSLRAPMGSGGNPRRNGPSKNIFFKFRGDSAMPGVWMYTNPQQLSISMNKRLPQQVTRGGFVIFHWGDELDEITASGITGSFCRMPCEKSDTGAGYTGSQPDFGLDRRDTWPYKRFMELLAIYRNNGIRITRVDGRPIQTGGFSPDQKVLASARGTQPGGQFQNQGFQRNTSNAVDSGQVSGARSERPTFVPIELHYDDNVFTGYFSSLVWTERADAPFVFSFDFKFTVLNTEYNRVFVPIGLEPVAVKEGLLANFQIPRYNSI